MQKRIDSDFNFPDFEGSVIWAAGHSKMFLFFDEADTVNIVLMKNGGNFLMILFLSFLTAR